MNDEQAAAVGSRLSSDQTRLAENMITGEVLLDKVCLWSFLDRGERS
jgi:hypothetical protein